MKKLYTNQTIRKIEAEIIHDSASDYELMEQAGKAALEALLAKWPSAKRIIVCCGKGNNAGDGYVLALRALQHGLTVSVITLFDPESLQGAALQAAQAAKQAGITPSDYHPEQTLQADIIVDALLGSGLQGDVEEPFASLIEAINCADIPVLALDIPSGLDIDTGSVHGCAVHADLTMTFIARKTGLYTNQASAYCGEIQSSSIGIADEVIEQHTPRAELMDWNTIKVRLPERRRSAHKGDYGHVLVIGGDYGMGGAVRMAAEAAMRVGAGLVSVATRPEHVGVVNTTRPEIMCHQVAEPSDLESLLERISVVVIGPGLGKSDWAQGLLDIVCECQQPKVLDADSLNLLSKVPAKRDDWILTPHPGEAARLLDIKCQDVQQDRFQAAAELEKRYGGVIALKGAGTLIQAQNQLTRVCQAGNPGMATGGMGDVLSGVIGGLLAQHLSLFDAASVGVMVHSMAADLAAQKGGERGLLASDLMLYLRQLVNP